MYTHLFAIGMVLGGGLTSFQVPISRSCLCSISIAHYHSGQSYEALGSLRLLYLSAAIMVYICTSNHICFYGTITLEVYNCPNKSYDYPNGPKV
jgi:hypothetical protein